MTESMPPADQRFPNRQTSPPSSSPVPASTPPTSPLSTGGSSQDESSASDTAPTSADAADHEAADAFDWDAAVARINASGPAPFTAAGDPATAPGSTSEPDISDILPVIGNFVAETVRYQTVALTDMPGAASGLTALTGPVDLGSEELSLYSAPAEGVVVTHEQRWVSRGVTLGRLLHSLALAPGESTRVAVVDWQRGDTGSATDTAQQSEAVQAATDDRRRVDDQASAAARQQDEGESTTRSQATSTSYGFSAGLAGSLFGLGGSMSSSSTSSYANTVSRSANAREATASAVQDIAARTAQAASAARARQATVVKEVRQAELAQASTRVVTNYNHMHALSVQYYEVVQAYEVSTVPVRIDRCVFVPLAPLTFTPALVRRYIDVIAAAAPPAWAARIRDLDPFASAVVKTRSSHASGLLQPTAGGDRATIGSMAAERVPKSPQMTHLAAASDGTVWGVRMADGIPVWLDRRTSTWVLKPEGLPPGARVTRVATCRDNMVFALTTERIYLRTGTAWEQTTNGQLADISCGIDGATYGCTAGHGTFYNNNINNPKDPNWGQMKDWWTSAVAVADEHTMWVIGTDGNVYRGNHDTSAELLYQAKKVTGIGAGADKSLWAIDDNHSALRWDATKKDFLPAFPELPEAQQLTA